MPPARGAGANPGLPARAQHPPAAVPQLCPLRRRGSGCEQAAPLLPTPEKIASASTGPSSGPRPSRLQKLPRPALAHREPRHREAAWPWFPGGSAQPVACLGAVRGSQAAPPRSPSALYPRASDTLKRQARLPPSPPWLPFPTAPFLSAFLRLPAAVSSRQEASLTPRTLLSAYAPPATGPTRLMAPPSLSPVRPTPRPHPQGHTYPGAHESFPSAPFPSRMAGSLAILPQAPANAPVRPILWAYPVLVTELRCDVHELIESSQQACDGAVICPVMGIQD